jgi:hypothetical protein
MAENQKSIDGIIEKLALITDATQTLFPDGKSAIVFELNYIDFKKVQTNFRQIDQGYKQFKIDLSGVEIIFIMENSIQDDVVVETPKKRRFRDLLSLIRGKSSI